MKIVPEILFIIIEFPIATAVAWTVICWYTCGGIFSFLFWLIFSPVAFILGTIGYLVVGSYMASKETRLKGEYVTWINIHDESLKKDWEGKLLPMREAYEWYIRGKISFNKPLLEVFLHRFSLFRMIFT